MIGNRPRQILQGSKPLVSGRMRRVVHVILLLMPLTVSSLFAQSVPVLNELTANPPGLSQTMAILGSGPFTLTVNGRNFVPGSKVFVESTPLETTYDSPTKLRATVTSPILSRAGAFRVKVISPSLEESNWMEMKVVERGDIDGSRSVNIGDALALARNVSGLDRPLLPPEVADLNLSGSMNIGDALALALFTGGMTVNLQTPSITSVDAATRGAEITISGIGFSSVASSNSVSFRTAGGITRVQPSAATAVSLKVKVPDDAISGAIQVYRLDIPLGSCEFPLLVAGTPTPLMLASIQQAVAPVARGGTITLRGLGFDSTASNNIVTFTTATGTVAGTVTAATGMELKVIVPQTAVSGGISVTTGSRTSESRSVLISGTSRPLQLLDILGGGVPGDTLVIEGMGFDVATPSNNLVQFTTVSGTAMATVLQAGGTQLQVQIPAEAVAGLVTVTVAGQRSNPLPSSRPGLLTISPSRGAQGSSVMVTLTGTNFVVGGTAVSVSGSGVAANNVSVMNSTTLTATFVIDAAAGLGNRDVTVATAAGSSGVQPFRVDPAAPTLTRLNPATGIQGTKVSVELTGSNFVAGGTTVSASGSGLLVSSVNVINSTTLSASFQIASAAATGGRGVTVSTAGGTSNPQIFTINEAPVETITILDETGSFPARELIVKEGGSTGLQLRVIDAAGNVRTGVPVNYESLDPAVATVDPTGQIQGKTAGFATLKVTDGTRIATVTATVVQVVASQSNVETTGVAQDLSRRLYLTTSQNHTVLVADDINQPPSLYAGVNQSPGFVNAARLESLFHSPAFLALDQADGTLYVSDTANNVIRRVLPAASGGTVETFAGTGMEGGADGSADTATFRNPQGIALDGTGYLWVADGGNHTIRRIHLATRTVETIAGKRGVFGLKDGDPSQALFNSPGGIALESETVALQLERFFKKEGPSAVRMLVADSSNGVVRRVSANGQVDTLLAPAGSSIVGIDTAKRYNVDVPLSFSSPRGIATDPVGNIYLSEPATGMVKTILANGDVVSAVPSNTFVNPQSLVITGTGRVVVASGNRSVQEIRYGQPQIASVQPNDVSMAGGDTVTITGSNFGPDTIVILKGQKLTGVVIQDTKTLRFNSPALPSGASTITVQNRGGLAQAQFVIRPVALADLQPGYITTITGRGDYVGDGGAATAAIVSPGAMAVDAIGNLYISSGSRIRRVDSRTGLITTIAGNNPGGDSADGVLATLADLSPIRVAVDGAGNIYTFSRGSLRKIDSGSGIVTTVAQNVSAGELVSDRAGTLYFASGGAIKRFKDGVLTNITAVGFVTSMSMDPTGTVLYFTDYETGVKKVTFSGNTWIVEQILPWSMQTEYRGVVGDSKGNVFITKYSGNQILWRPVGTTTFVPFAGTGQAGFGGDNGPAAQAMLSSPGRLITDSGDNLYIADGYRIRRISRGIITTVAGSVEAYPVIDNTPAYANNVDLRALAKVTSDSAGNVFVSANSSDFPLYKISGSTGNINSIAALPSGIQFSVRAVDSAGNEYFADSLNHVIKKTSNGVTTIIAGIGIPGFSGDGGPALQAQFNGPSAVALGQDGRIFVLDQGKLNIRMISSGRIDTIGGLRAEDTCSGCLFSYVFLENAAATSAGFYAESLTVDPTGNIYVTDPIVGHTAVRAIRRPDEISANPNIPTLTSVTPSSGVQGSTIHLTLTGSNFVAGQTSVLISGSNGIGASVGSVSATVLNSTAAVVDFVLSSGLGNFTVRALTPVGASGTLPFTIAAHTLASSGVLSTSTPYGVSGDGRTVDGSAGSARFDRPTALWGDTTNLYVASVDHTIRKITFATGEVTTLAGVANSPGSSDGAGSIARFRSPTGIWGDGVSLYVSDTGNATIRKVAIATGAVTTLAGQAGVFGSSNGTGTAATFSAPRGIWGSGNSLYIADRSHIRRLDLSTLQATIFAGSPGLDSGSSDSASFCSYPELCRQTATFTDLHAMWGDSLNLYVSDYVGFTIRKLEFATGRVTTIAGQTFGYADGHARDARFYYPEAIWGDGTNLYIADQSAVRRLDLSTSVVSTIAGSASNSGSVDGAGASARFSLLTGIWGDGASLYLANYNSDTIRRIFSPATSGIISTVAGNGTYGFSGDGSVATSASLSHPTDIAVDVGGNIFIADSDNNRIRKVTASGIISTFAGNGARSFTGDGGPATSAALNGPRGVAVDALGNVLIADSGNHRIRKVTPDGIIRTVAGNGSAGFSGDGGPATSAGLLFPFHIALDAANNLYIADSPDQRVRKVTPAGIISTVAGTGTAGFSGDGGAATSAMLNEPFAVAVDSAGDLFILDQLNSRIRKVTPGGIISTVAGTGAFGFSGDGGPATSAGLDSPEGIAVDGVGNLLIVEFKNRIRRVTPGGIISTIAGTGTPGFSGDGGPAVSALLNSPEAVAVDNAGNFFIADYGNSRIRKVTISSITLSVAPTSVSVRTGTTQQFTATITGATNTSVTWSVNGISGGNATVGTVSNSGLYTAPTVVPNPPIVFVTATSVADPSRFASATVVFSGITISLAPASAVILTGTNYQFTPTISGTSNTAVTWSVNGISGGNTTFGTISASGLFTAPSTIPTPSAFSVTATSVADSSKSASATVTIARISVSVTPASPVLAIGATQQFTSSLSGTTNAAVTWGVNGIPGGDALVGTISSTGLYTAPTKVPTPGTVTVGATSAADPSAVGTALVNVVGIISTVAGNGSEDFSGDGGPAISAGLSIAASVTVDSKGNLYVPDEFTHRIRKVTPEGIISTVAGNGIQGFSGDGGPATSASLYHPLSVAVDSADNLFISDSYNYRIRKVTPDGIIRTVAGNGLADRTGDGGAATSASLYPPQGLAVDGAGNLFIAAPGHIRKVTPDGTISTFAGNGIGSFGGDGGPATSASIGFDIPGLAADAAGNLFIADQRNNRIRKVTPDGIISTVAGNGGTIMVDGTIMGDHGPATSASLNTPFGVAVDVAGNLFVAEGNNHVIRKVNPNGIITTVAGTGASAFSGDGGPATSASLSIVRSVAVDRLGSLFIADSSNDRIRKVTNSFPTVSVAPDLVSVPLGTTQQFTATIGGSVSTAVMWSVNGFPGGNAQVGTITTSGLYTAPPVVPVPPVVSLTATSVADSTKSATVKTYFVVPGWPTVTITGGRNTHEGFGAVFTVTRTGPTTAALVVNYRVSGTASFGDDYSMTDRTKIQAGQTTAFLSVDTQLDSLDEPPESVTLTLETGDCLATTCPSNAAYNIGSSRTATNWIWDRVFVTGISSSDTSASEAGPKPVTLNLILSTADFEPLNIFTFNAGGSAAFGTDYTINSALVPAGATSGTITLTPVDDSIPEAVETVIVTVAPAGDDFYSLHSPYPSVLVTIADNDALP